jgi:sterol desaturase/sphingolipid hydroxylase (fatty acid hydroxylase superfamily)
MEQFFAPNNLFYRGLLSGVLAVALTAALEVTCWADVRKFRESERGQALYRSAILTNVRNNALLGPITYYAAVRFFCAPAMRTLRERIQCIAGIVLIEALLYYVIHKAFHEIKGLHWMHSYHHLFNKYVLPSSANAVSVAEYVFAYMVPLVLGVVVTRADEPSAFLGSAIVAITNLMIHTPWLEDQKYHWMFVTAGDHMSHHRKTKGNYGAPVFHIDRILDRCSSFKNA